MRTILGIDIGTTGCKCTLFSENGQVLAAGYRRNTFYHPRPGLTEQESGEWWDNVCAILREMSDAHPDGMAALCVIGVSSTNGVFSVDEHGAPLCRAVMQMDNRTTEEVRRLRQEREEIFSIARNRVAEGLFSLPTLLWLQRERPEIFAATYKFMLPSSHIIRCLTGEYVVDYSRASTTLLMDMHALRWSEYLCEKYGIGAEKLPRLCSAEQIAGMVTAECAARTGLPQGVPVAAGAMDTMAAAVCAGVCERGDAFMVLGTIGRTGICVPAEAMDDRFLNCMFIPEKKLALMLAANTGSGISMRWFQEEILTGNIPFDEMDRMAQAVPAGSEGLVYLPYIAGERTPIWDAHARGVYFGITPGHGRGHFIRAIMEGVAYSMRQNLDIIEEELRLPVNNIRVSGGGSNSALWTQIIADVLNRPLTVAAMTESETRGAAALACRAVGMDAAPFTKSPLPEQRQVVPRAEEHAIYEKTYRIYTSLYPALKESFSLLPN